MTQKLPTTEVLTMNVLALEREEIFDNLISRIKSRHLSYTCMPNVYCAVLYHKNTYFRKALSSADFVIADGLPLVWFSKLKGRKIDRIRGSDLILSLCELSKEQGFSHFFYGGEPSIPEMLSKNLAKKYPWLDVVGTYAPPFRPFGHREDLSVIEEINRSNPDILWVGLGAPKQEVWMHQHRNQFQAPMMIGVGAAFDFLSGAKKPAPTWMQNCGLEWLVRWTQEPRRLSKRYIWYNSVFLMLVLSDLLKTTMRR